MSPVKSPGPHPYTPVTLITVSLLLLLMPISWTQQVRDGIRTVLSPTDRLLGPTTALIADLPALLAERRDFRDRRIELTQRIQDLEIGLQTAQTRVEELQRSLESITDYRRIAQDASLVPLPAGVLTRPAGVLAWPGGALRDGLLIDIGRNAGVRPGDAVVHRFVVVGRVISAGLDTSEVQLLTDPGFRAGGVTQKTGIEGMVQGESMDTCLLRHVALSDRVEPGELVLTSGFAGTFPRGLVVGQLTEAVPAHDGRFQRIVVVPAAVPRDLRTVLVLVKSQPEN